jgi:hypothetical protein
MRKSVVVAISLALVLAMVVPTFAAPPDPGTGKANIFLQNIAGTGSAADFTLNFTRGWDSTVGTASFSYSVSGLGDGAAKSLLYTKCWQDGCTSPNTPVPDGWAGAVEIASSAPLATIVNMFWDGIPQAGTYSGVGAPDTTVYMPNLLKSDTRRTIVSVQNTEATDATGVQMLYYDRTGALKYTGTATIAAGSVARFDLSTIAGVDFSATSGTGSLKITHATHKLAAVASIHYPSGDRGAAVYSGFTGGSTKIWYPSQFRRMTSGAWSLYNANIVQNIDTAAANVTINFLGKDAGYTTTSCTDSIQPGASAGYNMITQGTAPAGCWTAIQSLGDNWVGTVMVESTNAMKLAGVGFYFSVNNVKDVLGFEAIPDEMASNKVYAPAVYRKIKSTVADGSKQWSATLVQNLGGSAVTVDVKFFSSEGVQVGSTYNVSIPANGSIGLNMWKGVNLPQAALDALDAGTGDLGFNGGMVVSAPAGSQLVGITNIFYEAPGTSLGRELGAAYDCFPAP